MLLREDIHIMSATPQRWRRVKRELFSLTFSTVECDGIFGYNCWQSRLSGLLSARLHGAIGGFSTLSHCIETPRPSTKIRAVCHAKIRHHSRSSLVKYPGCAFRLPKHGRFSSCEAPKQKDSQDQNAEHLGGASGHVRRRTVTEEAVLAPNIVSLVRFATAPGIGYLIMSGSYLPASFAVAVSGASDWLDGYLARRLRQDSVLGTYLDPLADKALIACVAGALVWQGLVPGWAAAVFVARDAALVAGAVHKRFEECGGAWPGVWAFFRVHHEGEEAKGRHVAGPGEAEARESVAPPPAVAMKPLMISKVNTCLQIGLGMGALAQGAAEAGQLAAFGIQGTEAVDLLRGWVEWLTYSSVGTTVVSGAAYAWQASRKRGGVV